MGQRGPQIERAQDVFPKSAAETKDSEAVEPARFQTEPTKAPAEEAVGDDESKDSLRLPAGGLSNQMTISPYRCALCKMRFSYNGKMRRRAASCG